MPLPATMPCVGHRVGCCRLLVGCCRLLSAACRLLWTARDKRLPFRHLLLHNCSSYPSAMMCTRTWRKAPIHSLGSHRGRPRTTLIVSHVSRGSHLHREQASSHSLARLVSRSPSPVRTAPPHTPFVPYMIRPPLPPLLSNPPNPNPTPPTQTPKLHAPHLLPNPPNPTPTPLHTHMHAIYTQPSPPAAPPPCSGGRLSTF